MGRWTIVNETPEPVPAELPKTLADAPIGQVYMTTSGQPAWRTFVRGLKVLEDGRVDIINLPLSYVELTRYLGPAPKIRWDE